jgi:phthalate 4,5-cis-dihydrodiol dehydrogenase
VYLGALRAITNLCFTDWVRRPRKPSDLDWRLGGGVSFRQGAHQFDVIRLVASRPARQVTASGVPIAGGSSLASYSALLEYDDGLYATAVYSGLGHFDSRLLTFGVGESGERLPPGSDGYRRLIPSGQSSGSPMFGLTIATFDEADVVPSPDGLLLERDGVTEVWPYRPGPSGWMAVLDELADTVLDGERPTHDGQWGVGTVEICAAVETAAGTGRSVRLNHQVLSPGA